MQIRGRKVLHILIIYIALNVISYFLFSYYTDKYRKVEVQFYFEHLGNAEMGKLFEENFKNHLGNLQAPSHRCFKVSLVTNTIGPQEIDLNNLEGVETHFKSKVRSALEKYNIPGLNVAEEDFSDPFCEFKIDSPFNYRFRALYFVFLFNLIHAVILYEGIRLVRHKDERN